MPQIYPILQIIQVFSSREVWRFLHFLSHLHSFINMFDYFSNYRAWSQIVYSLIPNVELLETQLDDFSTICAADEVVLFERATFLVISHISKLK